MNFGTMEPTFFYSRRIGSYPSNYPDGNSVKMPSATAILGATKISGKITDSWATGGVSAITRREYASVKIEDEDSKVEVEPLTSYNLFRTLKEFNQGRQGLGLVATYVDRQFEDESLRSILSDKGLVFKGQSGVADLYGTVSSYKSLYFFLQLKRRNLDYSGEILVVFYL